VLSSGIGGGSTDSSLLASALGDGSATSAKALLEQVYQRAVPAGAPDPTPAQLKQAERDATALFLEFQK
jgi:hypothetical protein